MTYELKDFLTDTEIIHVINIKFIKNLEKLAKLAKIPTEYFDIAQLELERAIHETNIDLSFIDARRKNKAGISHGKIAGCLCFRLQRNKIIQIVNGFQLSYPQQKKAYKLQDLTAITVALELCLSKFPDTHLIKELDYISNRRHLNQEMLALYFDTIIKFTK